MTAYRKWRQAALAALLLVVTIAAWIAFAPIQLGGAAAYVMIDGNSMEPRFHWGDLVIVRRQPGYQVGDMVAYQNPDLHRFVFHRIIASEGNHFIVKGDHNGWDDSYQPVPGDVVGSYWFSLPRLGGWIRQLREPTAMGLMAGILAVILMLMLFRGQRGNDLSMKNKRLAAWFDRLKTEGFRGLVARISPGRFLSHPKTAELSNLKPDARQPRNFKSWGSILEALFFALALILFASLTLGYFAFTRPTQQKVPADIPYQHVGKFSYSASAPAGIYDSRTVQSGDPIFPGLTCLVNLRFSYALAGIPPDGIAGSYQLTAKILDPRSGWQRTLPLAEEKPFAGGSFVASAPIDLCQVESLVSSVQKQTGLQSADYVLRIAPAVKLNGTVSGVPLQSVFQPHLDFRFNPILFSMIQDDPKQDPLNPSQAAVLKRSISKPNTLPIFGMNFAVTGLRLLSILGLIVSLLAMLGIWTALSSAVRADQAALLQIKYGPLLVDARQKNLAPTPETIEIASMDDLARLAERHNTMILFQQKDRIHHYSVRGDGRTYRYAISEGFGGASSVPLVQLEEELERGLQRGEFEVYYQPILSLTDGKVFGVEALLRWQHPEHGLLPAADFIPAAEAAGLINPLGDWLLAVACQQLQNWRGEGLALMLSINLSEQQLMGDPSGSIRRVVQNTGVDPHDLQIEIPGPEMLALPQTVIPKLQDLKDLGIRISVDESSGSSALSSISQFPLTGIKINRPTVQRMIEQNKAMALQRMIQAARGRGLQVGAVGVETQEQMEFLKSQYCNFAQGYLVGRPVSAEQLARSLLNDLKPGEAPESVHPQPAGQEAT